MMRDRAVACLQGRVACEAGSGRLVPDDRQQRPGLVANKNTNHSQ